MNALNLKFMTKIKMKKKNNNNQMVKTKRKLQNQILLNKCQ